MPLQAGNNSAPVHLHKLVIPVQSALTGVFASLPNPAGIDLFVHRAYIRVTTASTGASTADIGIHASSATTNADNLLDGISLASTGIFDSQDGTDNGTNGVAKPQVWAAAGFINVGEASGDVAGFAGTLYVEYSYL